MQFIRGIPTIITIFAFICSYVSKYILKYSIYEKTITELLLNLIL